MGTIDSEFMARLEATVGEFSEVQVGLSSC